MATQASSDSATSDSTDTSALESPPRDPYHDLMKKFGYEPKDDASTNFDKFMAMRTQAFSIMMQLRKNLHYHMERDDLEGKLNLAEFDELFGGLKTRVEQKDLTAPAKRLGRVHEIPIVKPQIVDTPEGVSNMLDAILPICRAASSEPTLYIDCEGVDLGRDGSVTILSMHCPASGEVYLVDVLVLQDAAFTTAGTGRFNQHKNLRTSLEDSRITKALWDCRKDSDALHAHYGIKVAGVLDIQLMDVITKKEKDRKRLNGLDTAFTSRLNVTPDDEIYINVLGHCVKIGMEEGVTEMKRIFLMDQARRRGIAHRPSVESSEEDQLEHRVAKGLAKSAMEERPLSPAIEEYCAQDVLMLPMLYECYMEHPHYNEERQLMVELESKSRVCRAREPVWPWDDMIAPPSTWKHAYFKKVVQQRKDSVMGM